MIEALPEPKRYAPFKPGPFRLDMGLQPLQEHEWIEVDREYAAQVARKRVLLEERPTEVFGALPGSEEASREVLELLSNYVCAQFPDWFQRTGSKLQAKIIAQSIELPAREAHPLVCAARFVQEDLCVLERAADGALKLTAAVVCFPSRWVLSEKLGRTLSEIHAPVPFYAEQLGAPVDRFVARFRTGQPVWRVNWNVHDSPELFQPRTPPRPADAPPLTAQNAGEQLWLRVERQTLRRLPRSNAVLFTIRTYVYALSALVRTTQDAAQLLEALRALPAETVGYKGQAVWRGAGEAWLAQRAK